MLKTMLKLTMVSAIALSAARCAELYDFIETALPFCQGENAPFCIFAGVVAAAALGAAIGPGAVLFHHVSDTKLKSDVRYHSTTKSGIKLYTYRYKGDERIFLGVLAQELARDKRWSKAVSRGKDGYLRVNYAMLGMTLKNGGAMAAAGEAAALR